MNQNEIKDWLINNILKNNRLSGKRMSEKYFQRIGAIAVWKEITSICETNNLSLSEFCFRVKRDILFEQKFVCSCGNKLGYLGVGDGYSKHCSYKCAANSKETRDRFKQTTLNLTGYDHPSKNPAIKQKKIDTVKQKYGVDNPFQIPELIERFKRNYHIKIEKEYITKKKNGTTKGSKAENILYEKLLEVYPDIKRHIRDKEKYPWFCDFYIPSKDLWIEYQGNWMHYNEPFNENNAKHLEIVNTWTAKAQEIGYKGKPKAQYLNAIDTWTRRDVEKRKWAKEHNLNFLEIFYDHAHLASLTPELIKNWC